MSTPVKNSIIIMFTSDYIRHERAGILSVSHTGVLSSETVSGVRIMLKLHADAPENQCPWYSKDTLMC